MVKITYLAKKKKRKKTTRLIWIQLPLVRAEKSASAVHLLEEVSLPTSTTAPPVAECCYHLLRSSFDAA